MSIFYLLPKGSAPYQYWLPYWLRKSFNCSQVPETCHSNLPQVIFHFAIVRSRTNVHLLGVQPRHWSAASTARRPPRHNNTTSPQLDYLLFGNNNHNHWHSVLWPGYVMYPGLGALGLNHSDSDTNNILVPEPEKDKIKLLVKLLL